MNFSQVSLTNNNSQVDLSVIILRYSTLPIIILLAILGNVLVCLAVHSRLQTITNVLIFNLAIADCIIGAIVLPTVLASTIANEWIADMLTCKVVGVLNTVILVISIWILAMISVVRLILVAYPHRSHTLLSKRKSYTTIVIFWIWSFVSGAIAEAWSPYSYHPEIFDCWYDYSDPTKHHLFMAIANFLLPLSIMIYAYIKIYLIMRKQYRSFGSGMRYSNSTVIRVAMKISAAAVAPSTVGGPRDRSQSEDFTGNRITYIRAREESKIRKMMFVVLLAFLICWLPGALMLQLHTYIKPIPPIILNACFILGYANSAVNCFIYGFLNKTFRQSFERILKCQKCRKSASSSF